MPYHDEETLTDAQKQQMILEYEINQQRRYQTGKVIVWVIAMINIVGSIVNFVLMLTGFFNLLVQIAFSIALICGVAWVRYLFAIGAAIGAVVVLITIGYVMQGHMGLAIFLLAYGAYSVICSILLFANKSVSEFLYGQRNG